MAKFNSPAEFINSNVNLLADRQSSMYSLFLESKPTFTTYYHINKIRSRTDKGLKLPEKLNGALSPIRYNKLLNFPLYGIEQIQLQLDEDEEGLTSDYSGEAVILPNTIHPTVDDYFIIDYLEKKYMFRVVKYDYDTIKSNNYYKIEFSIQSVDVDFFNDIERQVVKTYYTQFDNIGTDDKVFLTDENVGILDDIRSLYDGLVTDYLNNYYLPYKDRYNTLLYITPSNLFQSDFDYIFNHNLVYFCNRNGIFYDHNSTDAVYFYEEPRRYFHVDYPRSIFDLVTHYEEGRLNLINKYFTLEPTASMSSIFMYYRDKRVKYLREYSTDTSVFGEQNSEYIPLNMIDAIINKDLTLVESSPIDTFICSWLIDRTDISGLVELAKDIPKNHNDFSFHNFTFIPILLYCLFDLANQIQNDSTPDSIEDELANEMGCENV